MPHKVNFKGEIPASKSILNRCLICASYSDQLQLQGDSQCDDVRLMKQGLKNLIDGKVADCGSAGTVFRFLTLKASRIPGQHTLSATTRLLSRPQKEISNILEQLGCHITTQDNEVTIQGDGWKIPPTPLLVDRSQSSQFATGLIINAWNLDRPLKLEWTGSSVSEGYFQMTLSLLKEMGMTFEVNSSGMTVFPQQNITCTSYRAETDVSSAFAVSALAALTGQATIENFPHPSLQPDAVFVDILEKMGVSIEISGSQLKILPSKNFRPIEWNLNNCPDLFPVLGTLCAFVEGTSILMGAPHLTHKESDRQLKTAELIKKLNRSCEVIPGGIKIYGKTYVPPAPFFFDTDQDHRLAFASSLAIAKGYEVTLSDKSVVNKSFPEFWEMIGIDPKVETSS